MTREVAAQISVSYAGAPEAPELEILA